MKSLKIISKTELGEKTMKEDTRKNFGPIKRASFRMVGIDVMIAEKPYSISFNFISNKLQGALNPENFRGMVEENMKEKGLQKDIDYEIKEEL